MPTEYDWPDETPTTEEDAVRAAMKRLERLSKGICGDLWKMHQNCHREVFENGNMEHMPMNFVAYQEGDDKSTRELFYICRKCLSEYLVKHPEASEYVLVLRGNLTPEAERAIREYEYKKWQEEQERLKQEEEKMKQVFESDHPCPICGKPFNKHTPEDFKKCMNDYVEINPQEE